MINTIANFIQTFGIKRTTSEEYEMAERLWRIEYPHEPFEYVLNMIKGKQVKR